MGNSEKNDPMTDDINLYHHMDKYVHENDELNDTSLIWNLFDHKPSRISLYSTLDGTLFWSLLPESADEENMTINAEIVIEGDKVINTYKYLIKLEDSVYISLYEIREGDVHEITNITFYYNSIDKSIDDINEYLEIFQGSITTPVIDKYRYIVYNQGTIDTVALNIPVVIENEKLDFFELYPNKQRDGMRKILRDIDSDKNSVSCIYGDKGSNKQMFINYIVKNSNKNVILIPYNLAETFLSSMEITESIKRNPDTLFIINGTDGLFNNELLLGGLFQIIEGSFGTSIDVLFEFNDRGNINDNLVKFSDNFVKFDILSNKEVTKINKYLTDSEKELLEEIVPKIHSSYF